MILLDERARTEALDNEILLRALREIDWWRELAIKYICRAIFYRELCALQQRTIADERRHNARHRETIRQLREEIACRSDVTKERP